MANKTRSIKLSQKIAAPASKIYPKLIESKELTRWFPTRAESDPVVGGHYMLAFEFTDKSVAEKGNHTRKGQFLDLKPNERVRYTWEVDNTEVTFDLKQSTGGTEIDLIHSGWPEGEDEAAYQSHTRGWQFFLSNLKTLIEDGVDNRATAMGMEAKS